MKNYRILLAVFTFTMLLALLGLSNLTTTYAASPTPKPSPTMSPTPLPSPTLTPTPIPNPPYPDALKDKKLSIAWVGVPVQNVWIFSTAKRGAMKKAGELSKIGDYKVEVLDYDPNSWDWAAQIKMLEKAGSKKGTVDAIITDCFDIQACVHAINVAVLRGIPVLIYDRDASGGRWFTHYGIDNTEVGKIAADLLKEALPKGGDVAVYISEQEVGAIQDRYKGFKDGVEGSQLSIVTDITEPDGNKSCQLIEDTMKEYPDIKGWFFTSPMPILQNCANFTNWKKATQNGMLTVSADAFPEELDWIRAKKLYAAIDQPYWGWGYDTVQMMYDYMVYGKKFEKYTYVKPNIITLKNVNAYQDMVKKNDYSTPLPPYK